jgi:hypothetical protein
LLAGGSLWGLNVGEWQFSRMANGSALQGSGRTNLEALLRLR